MVLSLGLLVGCSPFPHHFGLLIATLVQSGYPFVGAKCVSGPGRSLGQGGGLGLPTCVCHRGSIDAGVELILGVTSQEREGAGMGCLGGGQGGLRRWERSPRWLEATSSESIVLSFPGAPREPTASLWGDRRIGSLDGDNGSIEGAVCDPR